MSKPRREKPGYAQGPAGVRLTPQPDPRAPRHLMQSASKTCMEDESGIYSYIAISLIRINV